MNGLKEAARTGLRLLAELLLAVAAGTVLLYLVFLLPTQGMHQNATDPKADEALAADRPCLYDRRDMMLDRFTDRLMLLTGFALCEDRPVLDRAIKAYRTGDTYTVEALVNAPNSLKARDMAAEYPRYWHGYLTLLKPLLMAFDYVQILRVNSVVQALAALAALAVLLKKAGAGTALTVAAGFALLRPQATGSCLSYSDVFYISAAGVMAVCMLHAWLMKGHRYLYGFALTGILTNYFDLLTYPLISLGLPLLVLLGAMNRQGERQGLIARRAFLAAAAWAFGYFGMWVGKWAMGSLLLRENLFTGALNQAKLRSSRSDDTGIGVGLWATCGYMFELAFPRHSGVILTAALLAAACGASVARGNALKELLKKAVPYAMVACMPCAWVAVFLNHSNVHYWMTYRIMILTVVSAMALAASEISLWAKERKRRRESP